MAAEYRHAAWHTDKSFAVQLLVEHERPMDLASGLPDFLAATDVAFDWLNQEDPTRTGSVNLVIVERRPDASSTVWSYPPPVRSPGQDLIDLFGFNPAAWEPHSGSRLPTRSTVSRRLAGTPRRPEPRALPSSEPLRDPPALPSTALPAAALPAPALPARGPDPHAAPPPPAPARPPLRVDRDRPARPATAATAGAGAPAEAGRSPRDWESTRRLLVTTACEAWRDTPSRLLLILSATALWLSLALADPRILVALPVLLSATWFRHQQARETAVDQDWY